MTINFTWPSASKLAWLTHLLREQFSQQICLIHESHFVAIRLAGSEGCIQIYSDSQFSNQELHGCTDWNYDDRTWPSALPQPLPAPGRTRIDAPLITRHKNGHAVNYDVLGLTYWTLSRREEVNAPRHDRLGRFPASESHAYRHSYLHRPIVDEWLFILRQVMQRQWPEAVFRPLDYSMRVSHDVDEPSRYAFKSPRGLARVVAIDVLRHRDWLAPLRALHVKLKGRRELATSDPANTFEWLMTLSERYGLRSAFYFICGRTHPTMDADYEPEAPAIRSLMRQIHSRGHEIGLHPSFETFVRPEAIAAEARRLRQICAEEGIVQEGWGGRMHYLRWSHPLTMRAWEQAGMAYDSTLGYADMPGFRCGTCHEYPAFDPIEGRMLNLRIRPLIAMEVTVMSPTYMGLGHGPAALARFAELIDACRAVGGCFTLLWHNSNLSQPGERALYEQVLALGAVETDA